MIGWKVVRLGECCDIVSGSTPRTNVKEYWDGDILWATPKDISELSGGYISDTSRKITPLGLKNCSARILPPESVLFTSRAPIGLVAINAVPMATNQGFKSFIPFRDTVDPKFLYYWLKAHRGLFEHLGNGATFKEISKRTVSEVEITLPPLPEQRRIAAILDKADELRAKRRAAIEKLDRLVESIFLEMFGDPIGNPFGWKVVELGEVLYSIESGKSPKCLDRPATRDEWGVLRLGAVTTCEFLPQENKALPPSVNPDTSIEVQKGDLLFSRKNTRELVAACAYVHDTPPRLLLSDLIFRLRIKGNAPVSPIYLQRLLTYPTKRREVQSLAGGSAGSMPNISKSRLSTVKIPLPPLELQKQFEVMAVHNQNIKKQYDITLHHLDELFSSLQQRAFRGELSNESLRVS